jgi:hypothetical protein
MEQAGNGVVRASAAAKPPWVFVEGSTLSDLVAALVREGLGPLIISFAVCGQKAGEHVFA